MYIPKVNPVCYIIAIYIPYIFLQKKPGKRNRRHGIDAVQANVEDENVCILIKSLPNQSGRSPKVVAHFSATNFSSYIIELLQLHLINN